VKLLKLHIKNFKSLVDLEIIEPSPFSVFAGANGVGKSNIFEALEFGTVPKTNSDLFQRLFGSKEELTSRSGSNERIEIAMTIDPIGTFTTSFNLEAKPTAGVKLGEDQNFSDKKHNNINNFWYSSFFRIFIGNKKELKYPFKDDLRLALDCSNLEKVLKRLLAINEKREEIIGYLQLFIPEFEDIEVHSDSISGSETLLFYQKGTDKPFPKHLISDGSFNILCLLTAVLQSDEPQFLCIEEPENGLTPYVIEEMVDFFRQACEEKGHYIWLNTHSQTLVRTLHENELILVGKENGATYVKQFKSGDFHGLRADEAWLNNALGAGLPW
jgi:predicted ATPase